jgi:threonine-phosphate decarboxylase
MAEGPAHRHGGEPLADFRRLGIRPRPVIDFSVNVNPLGPPPAIRRAWGAWVADLGRYPSPAGEGVKRFYQERFGLTSDCVLPGNGSLELLYLVPRALGLQSAAVAAPSFYDYGRAIRVNRGRVLEFPSLDETDADWEERVVRLLPQVQALFIGNPNNPTGRLIHSDRLLGLAARFPDKWFLVDEAFIQFVERPADHSLLQRERLRRNILVFHSLTKFYALAGLRLGAVVGHPETLARLRAGREPWSVSLPAERAAALLPACLDYEEQTRRLIRRERGTTAAFLRSLPGLEALAPTANFVLARWRAAADLDDLLRFLLERGLYVRDARNFSGLSGNWFRFALLGSEENRQLRQALSELGEGC